MNMPLILKFWRQRQVNVCDFNHPNLHDKFQSSQGYIMRCCLIFFNFFKNVSGINLTVLTIITLKPWRNASNYWQVDLMIFPHLLSIPVYFLVKDLIKSFSMFFLSFSFMWVQNLCVFACVWVSCKWECTFVHVES